MNRLGLLTVCLLLTVGAWANPKAKMAANLQKRCKDGIAVACSDYAKHLASSKSKADKRKAKKFFRRACDLAYAPACDADAVVAVTKAPKKRPKPVDPNACTGEKMMNKTIRPGDTVLTVNDEAFSSNDQLAAAIEGDGASIVVLRETEKVPFTLKCP